MGLDRIDEQQKSVGPNRQDANAAPNKTARSNSTLRAFTRVSDYHH